MIIFNRKIYTGNKWKLILNTGINLADTTLLQFKVIKPSGDTEVYTATRVGSTSKMYHVFSSSELDEAGLWKIQSYVEFGSSDPYLGNTYEKYIYEAGQ